MSTLFSDIEGHPAPSTRTKKLKILKKGSHISTSSPFFQRFKQDHGGYHTHPHKLKLGDDVADLQQRSRNLSLP